MSQNNFDYVKKPLPLSFGKYGFILIGIGLIWVILSFIFEPLRATFNSLLIFTYLIGLGLCSLFLVGLEYIAGAVWSVPFRRIGEYLAILIFIAPIFAIPVLFNLDHVFHWAEKEAVMADKILQWKSPYLNPGFFYIRIIVILALAALFSWLLIGNSAKQDKNPDQKYTRVNIKLSAIFIPVFGISITVIAVDWIMSLSPHWFSTIFGIYYFAGSLLATFAVLTLFAVKLKNIGAYPDEIAGSHFYNFGAYMFAFTNFWAYIAFSQFLLIWYANLPEETVWFLSRSTGSWFYVSLGIILINFIIPYAGLLSQPSKSNLKRLKIIGVWLLFAHYYDLYWLIMPSFSKQGATVSWVEPGFIIFAVGLVMALFKIVYEKRNLMPIGDPKLKRALEFHL
ncbi:MAG: hypothetical protein QG635_879 [Bacteroidota bacterium]|nr:hypothetical protein [Bacteroidota bacterium]